MSEFKCKAEDRAEFFRLWLLADLGRSHLSSIKAQHPKLDS